MNTFSRRLKYTLVVFTVVLGACSILGVKDMNNKEIRVTLSGANEVPPVNTSASGAGTIFVSADKTISGAITTTGITGTAAHIHLGAAGTNGPVIVPLKKSGDGGWSVHPGTEITEAQFASFKRGELYINVHSDAYKAGEIRGQLIP